MAIAAGWSDQTAEPGPLDVDQDGDLDVRDLMLAASHWGEACP
jgi:hypothetical protein